MGHSSMDYVWSAPIFRTDPPRFGGGGRTCGSLHSLLWGFWVHPSTCLPMLRATIHVNRDMHAQPPFRCGQRNWGYRHQAHTVHKCIGKCGPQIRCLDCEWEALQWLKWPQFLKPTEPLQTTSKNVKQFVRPKRKAIYPSVSHNADEWLGKGAGADVRT